MDEEERDKLTYSEHLLLKKEEIELYKNWCIENLDVDDFEKELEIIEQYEKKYIRKFQISAKTDFALAGICKIVFVDYLHITIILSIFTIFSGYCLYRACTDTEQDICTYYREVPPSFDLPKHWDIYQRNGNNFIITKKDDCGKKFNEKGFEYN